MSLQITIPKGDLAKSIPIENGWKKFKVTAAIARPSKDQGSINYVVTHQYVGDVNERSVDHNFNSKAIGMMAPWIAALAGKTVQEILDSITTGALTFDLESTIGKELYAKVNQELYEGRIIAKLIEFAPPDKVPF